MLFILKLSGLKKLKKFNVKKKFLFRIELNFLVIFPNTTFLIKYWEYSSSYKLITLKSEKTPPDFCLFF